MESQPQNPEFRNNPENFHPCNSGTFLSMSLQIGEVSQVPLQLVNSKVWKMKAQTKI